MNAGTDINNALESAIAKVYGGPLEDFIRRRDAMAKEIRATGDREWASTVKALRKPSRLAWALNLGAQDSQDAIDSLVAAVAATLAAQATGGDVRSAISSMRAAVREFARQAARAAGDAGHIIEPGVLANAVLAVLADSESFDQLRRGRLADIPEAGGLDFLSTLPAPTAATSTPTKAHVSVPAEKKPAGADISAREVARRAAAVLAEARTRANAAQRMLSDAESKLHAAEARLRQAEEEVLAIRSQCDRARQEVEAAAAQLLDAERTTAAPPQ